MIQQALCPLAHRGLPHSTDILDLAADKN